MRAAIDGYWQAGNYAVAVTDLQTGETVHAYGDRLQLGACVMNYFVLLQAMRDVQDGRYPLATVDALIGATTWSSNATTARELFRVAGGGDVVAGVQRVSNLIATLGLQDTHIDHPPGYGGESLGVDANNWITAVDANRALAALWNGGVLDEPQRTTLLDHLSAVKPGLNYLTSSVPTLVSHKNGFFPGDTGYVDNDAGIVRFTVDGEERAFAITFLSEEVPVKYDDIPLGQQLTWLAYETFLSRYGGTAIAGSAAPPAAPEEPVLPETPVEPERGPDPEPTVEPEPDPTVEPEPTTDPTAEPTPDL